MKKITVTYWIVTGLFAFIMFGSAVPDVLSVPMAVKGFATLGLPAYFVPFVGIAKVLGVIAILIPGYPRIKEWAYAGLTFDLISATYCLIASGQPVANWALMPLFVGLAFAAYLVYHRRLKVKKAAPATAAAQEELALA